MWWGLACLFSHSLSNTGQEGLSHPYISIFMSCSKHVITTELSWACWGMKLWALPLAHQRKPVPPAQPGGFAACQPWKQWWVWDGMGWGCSSQGTLLIAQPQGSLSLPLLWLPFLEQEELESENQSWSLVFHALKGKLQAGTWTQTLWHLHGLAERNNLCQALCKFSILQVVRRSVVWLHNLVTGIKVLSALLNFQNNNHN